MPSRKPPRSRRRPRREPPASIVDVDPEVPSQTLDESGDFHLEPLGVEALPSAEMLEELDDAAAEVSIEEEAEDEDRSLELGLTEDSTQAALAEVSHDTGELYGVHVSPAADRDIAAPEDHDSFALAGEGENWREALETSAIEGGVVPEHEVVVIDDSDVDHPTHHASDHRDRPVADKGSGGPAGL